MENPSLLRYTTYYLYQIFVINYFPLLRYIIVSLWPLCRLRNTTALLLTLLWDTKTGKEEEEYDTRYFEFYTGLIGENG